MILTDVVRAREVAVAPPQIDLYIDMCICICMCVYIYIYTTIYIYIYIYTYIHIYARGGRQSSRGN